MSADSSQVFEALLPMPLELVFVHWHGPLPPVRSTVGPEPWRTPGQQRRVVLAGPGWMVETLTEVDPPNGFSYHLDQVHGPMRALIASVEGRWMFESGSFGTKITWTWTATPRAAARWLMPAFARLWTGYANKTLGHLEKILAAKVSPS